MKKENKKVENAQTPLERFSNNNANLKRYLSLALKNTSEIMKVLLPKIAVEVRNVVQQVVNEQKSQVKTSETKKLINEKAIREHLYDLVGYKRKEEENGAFEIVVYRAIKLGKMLVDSPKEFDVDVTPTMLSICLYVTEEVDDEDDLTLTLIVDVSINELSKIYLWLNKDVSTVKFWEI